MSLLLMRHGQTDWNRQPAHCQGWSEIELNETGRAQVRDQGRALRECGLELIVSSHLLRARETAALLGAELDDSLPLIIDPRLAESHRGDWETRMFSEIMREEAGAWRSYREHPETFRYPGGESLVEQQRRVLASLRDCAADGRKTLLVTHGGCIRLIRCFLQGLGIEAFHETRAANCNIDDLSTEDLAERIARFLAVNPTA